MTPLEKLEWLIVRYGETTMALAMLRAIKEDRMVILTRDLRWALRQLSAPEGRADG